MPHTSRALALVVVLVGLLAAAYPRTGSASPGGPVHALRLAPPRLGAILRGPKAGAPLPVPAAVPSSRVHLDPSALRVQPATFAPATVTYDAVESNTDADDKAHDQFAQFHSTSYANLGRIGGNIQIADWKPAGGSVVFWYLSSFMTGAATANAAQADSVTGHTNLGGQPKPCVNGAPPPPAFPNCNYILTQDVQKTTYFADFVWAIGSCLLETDAQFPQSLDSATQSQVITTLDNITGAAAGLATQQCTGGSGTNPTATSPPAATPTATRTSVGPTATATATATKGSAPTATATSSSSSAGSSTVTIEAVRVESANAKADLTQAPLLIVKAGQKILLSIYVLVQGSTAQGGQVAFAFSAKRGGASVLSQNSQAPVQGSLPTEMRQTVTLTPSKQGKETFTGTITYQGKSQSQTTTFTVAGSTKKTCVTIDGTKYCS